MNLKFRHLQTSFVATVAFAMTLLPSFNAATFFGLTGAVGGIVLVTSCKSEEPEPPTPQKPTVLVPTAAGTLLTYAEWEAQGFSQLGLGTGGIKFDILATEAAKFAARPGWNPAMVNIRPVELERAEVTINNPGEFATGANKIKEFLTTGHDSVFVTMPNNIPVTPEVAGIVDQGIINRGNVVWSGGGAFEPIVADQEILGSMYENLPVGMKGDMRFYVPGKNDAHRIKYILDNNLINTDTISTSRFPTNLRAQKEIYVNTDYAVDAGNFSGYTRTNDPAKHIPVIVADGKKLVLENATVGILDRFQTDVVRRAYNMGYLGAEGYVYSSAGRINNDFGPNGPFQLIKLIQPYDENHDDLTITSIYIDKNDTIDEAGHFINGKDVSNGVFNQLERSRLNAGPIDFTVDGNKINTRWTNFPNLVLPPEAWILNKGSPRGWGFMEFVSKDLFRLKEYGTAITVKEDWCIITPKDVTIFKYNNALPQPSPEAGKYMLDNYNIIITCENDRSVYNSYPEPFRGLLRIPGGWEWKNR